MAGRDNVGFLSGHRLIRPQKPPLPPPAATAPEEEEADESSVVLENAKEGNDETIQEAKEGDETIQETTTQEEPEVDDDDKNDCVYQLELEAWKKEVAKRNRQIRRIRITVLFCGVCIIVCVILMCVKGAMSLDHAFGDGRNGLSQGKSLAQGAIDILDEYTTWQNATIEQALRLGDQLNGLCPAVTGTICETIVAFDTPLDVEAGCNFTDIPYADELESYLVFGRDFVFDALLDMRSDLLYVIDIMDDADDIVAKFHWAFYAAAAFAGVVGVLTALFMTGVVLTWKEELKGQASKNRCLATTRRCVHHFLLVPIYFLFVVLSWIFSMVFVIGSITTADTCVGSPDDRILVSVYYYFRDQNGYT